MKSIATFLHPLAFLLFWIPFACSQAITSTSSSNSSGTTTTASSTSVTVSSSSLPPRPTTTTIPDSNNNSPNNPASSAPQVNWGNLIVLTVVLVIYLGVYCSKPLFRVWLKLARLVTSAGTVRTTQRELALQAASPRMLDPIRRGHAASATHTDAAGRVMVVRDPELGVVVVEGGETLPRYASLGGGLAAAADGAVPVARSPHDQDVDLDAAHGGDPAQHATPPPSWEQHADHPRGPHVAVAHETEGAEEEEVHGRSRANSSASSEAAASVSAPLTGGATSDAGSVASGSVSDDRPRENDNPQAVVVVDDRTADPVTR